MLPLRLRSGNQEKPEIVPYFFGILVEPLAALSEMGEPIILGAEA
jgi:hypothetical protein